MTSHVLVGPLGHKIDIFVHSPKEIQKIMNNSWAHFVKNQISHRKGISDHHLDSHTTVKIFQSFSPSEQTILSLNMLGRYQTGAIKAIWAADCEGESPFCSQQDSRPHRILQCPVFEKTREQHPQAIQILSEERKDWTYLPIPRLFPDSQFLPMVHNSRVFPKPEDYALSQLEHHPQSILRFFTDGSCSNPMFERAKIAGWSIIQDLTTNLNTEKR